MTKPAFDEASQVQWQEWLQRGLKAIVLYNAPIVVGLLLWRPEIGALYSVGVLIGIGFAFSAWVSLRLGNLGAVLGLSFFRMVTIPLVAALVGQFHFVPTLVVFCGCLSYKWILFLEVFRVGVRQQQQSVSKRRTSLGH